MDALFSAANAAALLGWIALALAPLAGRRRTALRTAAGFVIPGLLAVVYAVLIALYWGSAAGGFGSIAQVRALFDSTAILVAGWLHYLAFDLFVGGWIARQGERDGVPHLLLLPCFALTFLFGPAGFLAFLFLRAVRGLPLLRSA